MRGEEILEGWKPRGLSLLRDYDAVRKTKRKMADVASTRSILASLDQPFKLSRIISPLQRLSGVIKLWQSYGLQEEVSFVVEREKIGQSNIDLICFR